MIAILLNSGQGTRMGDLTKDIPKCLVKINQEGNETLLGHQIKNIIQCGITELIITTGPFEEKIKTFVQNNFPNLKVTYIKNDQYKKTNYIYSLWLIKDLIKDNSIIMHGDLVFEKNLLEKLLFYLNKAHQEKELHLLKKRETIYSLLKPLYFLKLLLQNLKYLHLLLYHQ